ncbi:hypothetical protein [Chryseobacterium luquanense]|uniref:Teneurin-like YD-shell domain-containing protein n=1 Tax=Chryseobacterium luquanense TaxID=2983766 RepID=A0ABT3Y7B4_9FLAO|nr:hypothetical protein [Chryseobacterium luquanense]MCX8533886.1 hypothetical protein [Chryseobacterium luquanense]
MKKKYLLLLMPFFIACNSIKVKEIPIWDVTQRFGGKIEKIEMINYRIETSNLKSDTLKESGVMIFDKNNKVVIQNERIGKYSSEKNFQKDNKLFQSKTTIRGDNVNKEVFTYDKKGNVLQFNSYDNNILSTSTSYKYDSKGNLIERIIHHPNWKSNKKLVENRSYNYKSGYYISTENNEPDYYKIYFDKKGFIIKYDRVDKNDVLINSFMKYEYDSKGNLTKMCMIDNNGKEFHITTYKTTFDNKGNIIERERYLDNNLIEKTINKITYR